MNVDEQRERERENEIEWSVVHHTRALEFVQQSDRTGNREDFNVLLTSIRMKNEVNRLDSFVFVL